MKDADCDECGRYMEVSEGRYALSLRYDVPLVCRECRTDETD